MLIEIFESTSQFSNFLLEKIGKIIYRSGRRNGVEGSIVLNNFKKFSTLACLLITIFTSLTFAMEAEPSQRLRSSSLAAAQLILPEAGQPFAIVNPCTDFGFKKAFCNPIVLIDFLNHILDYRDGNQIVELSYMNKEFPSLDPLGRDFRVDIVCRTQSERYFLIEMQNDYTADYADKSYVEFARFLAGIDGEKIHDLSMGERKRRRIGETDIQAQEFWKKIEEVCTLVISNKRFGPEVRKEKYTDEAVAEPDVINTYEMRNTAHSNRHLGNLDAKVVLVMLANFNKTEDQLETVTDRWLFALKDERMATGKLKIDPFKEVSDIAKTASDSEALKQFYAELHTRNMGRDHLKDYEEQIQETNERLERTFAEGEVKGEQNAALRIAKALKSQGMEIVTIVAATGLSSEVIGAL